MNKKRNRYTWQIFFFVCTYFITLYLRYKNYYYKYLKNSLVSFKVIN